MKIKLIIIITTAFSISSFYSQDIVWTGGANDNNFFNEQNWKSITTNSAPTEGTINFNVAINLDLKIKDINQIITANGIINLGTGSLTLENANIKGNAISTGKLNIDEGGYLELENTNPLQNNIEIEINSGIGWVRTTNYSPDDVFTNNVNQIKVNQQTAEYKTNLRLDNYYFNGTVIRSNQLETTPFTIFDETNLAGNSASLSLDIIHSGSNIPNNLDNRAASFLLKKGFMATIADEEDGTGKSKNYIALEEDLIINQFPKFLQNNISFIRVIPWNWVSKKGIGGPETDLDNGWFYKWNNNSQSTFDAEYGPMSWGGNGANDDDDIALYRSIYKVTHVLAFNESDNCNAQSGQFKNLCQTDVAVGYYKNLMKTGLRLVSPSGTESAPFGWLKEFHDKATLQDVRIDVIGVHWYDWGSNPASNPNHSASVIFNRFKKYLQDVHDLYNLPIWITEFNANPNRNNAINHAFMQLALPYLETLDYVERYAWFQPNELPGSDVSFGDYHEADGTTLTNIGLFYKNQVSTPAIPESIISADNNLDIYYRENAFQLSDNTLINGDFETGDLTNWAGTNIDILNTDTVYAGETSGRIKANAGSIYQEATVIPNAIYNLSFFTRWFVAPSAPIEVKVLNTATNAVINSKLMGTSISWNLVETSFTVPSDVTSVKVIVEKSTGPGWFIDNVLLEKQETLSTSTFNENSFMMYPNPSAGIFNITSESVINAYSIYNLNGQQIQQKSNLNIKQIKINLLQQAKGIYFIKLLNVDGSVSSKKIIKN